MADWSVGCTHRLFLHAFRPPNVNAFLAVLASRLGVSVDALGVRVLASTSMAGLAITKDVGQ